MISKLTSGYAVDKLLANGGVDLLELISGAAFTMTGGALGAWTDLSNFRSLGGAQAPVIAEASDNLEAVPDEIFTPWASITWAAVNSAAIAALAGGQYGSESAKITCGADPTGGMGISRACTAGQPYTCSCQVKANNAGAIGKTARINWDGTTADVVLTANWQMLSVTDASASGTPLTASVCFTNGANADEMAVSAWQRGNKTYKVPFARDYRTATTCKIATPFAAGQAISMMFVVNTPSWVGSDGVLHYLFMETGTSSTRNIIWLGKEAAGAGARLVLRTYDDASALKQLSGVVYTAWTANANHVVIFTKSAAGALTLRFDGTPCTTAAGAGTGIDGGVEANIHIGTDTSGTVGFFNGSILSAIWGRVLTSGEITALSSLASWPSLTDITISGVSTGNAGRVYSGVTLKDSSVETGGIITLTPAGASRILKVYEDNTYAAEIDELVGT